MIHMHFVQSFSVPLCTALCKVEPLLSNHILSEFSIIQPETNSPNSNKPAILAFQSSAHPT